MKIKSLFQAAFCVIMLISIPTFAQSNSVLTLSEVMFYPFETNGEYIEIYNTSSTETIDLTNIKIKYSTSANNTFVPFIGGINLGPHKYAVVIQGNYDYENGIYKNSIAPDAIVLKLSTSNFGTSGMANTTSRDVYLIDNLGQTIDTYSYSADNNPGISDEKFLLTKDNSAGNWRNSIKLNGTPGAKNSVIPVKYLNDLSIKFAGMVPANPVEGDSVKVSFIIKNIGVNDAGQFSVEVFRDQNADSIGQVAERFYNKNFSELFVVDSVTVSVKYFADKAGPGTIISNVNYSPDENCADNRLLIKFTVSEKPVQYTELVINEVMYAPNNDEPEWIELVNKSGRQVNLKNCKIADNSSSTVITTSDYLLNSGDFVVLTGNASISNYFPYTIKTIVKNLPSFGNNGDDVILKSSVGTTIDSLRYLSTWGGSSGGYSLERLSSSVNTNDATNWKSSVSKYKGTPGKINSVTLKNYDLSIKNFSTSIQYAEVGKNIPLTVLVENIGKLSASNFTIKLYRDLNFNGVEDAGEQITEQQGSSLGAGFTANFSFYTNSFQLGVNQFIVHVEYSPDEFVENNNLLLKFTGISINETRGDLVVNEFMYAPLTGEPEWIEIFNRSQKLINLKGYQIGNGTSKSKVVNKDFSLKPDEFFLVAKDSSLFNKYPRPAKWIVSTFPILANTKDKIIILDSLNRTIDSLEYKSTWGGTNGKSLEKIDQSKSSTDSTNWKTSGNILGGTPGYVNSISKKNYDVAINKITFNPSLPIVGKSVRIRADISNNGKNDVLFKLSLFKINKDGTRQKVEETNSLSLSKGAALSYEFTYTIENISAKSTFEASIDFALDEESANNSITGSVNPGYLPGAVLLNEVLFNPLNGEPEWIELYNNSNVDIDLEDWTIGDVLTIPQKMVVKAKDYSFPKNSFLVVAKDSSIKIFHRAISSKLIVSSFPSLNNDADGVVIRDSRNSTIDSLLYDSKWGGESGKSIERKQLTVTTNDKSNWGSSKDIELSTPGRINSIALKKYDLALRAIIPSPLYPTVNQEVGIGARIINFGTSQATNFSVKYFYKVGNSLVQFGENSVASLNSNDSIIVTSTKIKLQEVKTILCKIVFSADEDTLNNTLSMEIIPGTKPNAILITEVMYSPLAGEPEWIEFVNASNEVVNLKEWSISDLVTPTKVKLTTKDAMLQPGEFAVATPDTHAYAFNPPKKFFQTKFGALGNTNDGVIIYDFRGAMIDSLNYKSSWGGGSGISLERISLTKATNDSTNWTSSLSTEGASAGVKNSASSPARYTKNSLVFNEIMYEPATGMAEFVEMYNSSNDSIQVGGMELKVGDKTKLNLSKHGLIIPSKTYFVLASDSSIYSSYPNLKLGGNVSISSSLNLSNDGTSLVAKDLYGTTLDSVIYSPVWHNRNLIFTRNKSLERLNPLLNSNDRSNWNTSVASEGGTPGKQNSIFTNNETRDSKVTVSPNPFSPDNDGFEDYAMINLELPYKFSQVRIKVFDNRGRLVRTLLENRPSASNNSVIFDGLDDDGHALRIGIYVLLIEIAADGSNSIETIKTPIVVARKL